MRYYLLLFTLFSCMIFKAQAVENGIKVKVQLKVFEGSTIMMHERNLSNIESCTLGIIGANTISGCSIEIKDIDRAKISGTFTVNINDFKNDEVRLNLSALANGYFGGGQDGPYFTFKSKFKLNEYQDYLLNLGFYSRTPELAQDYLVRVQILDWEACTSIEDCSKF